MNTGDLIIGGAIGLGTWGLLEALGPGKKSPTNQGLDLSAGIPVRTDKVANYTDCYIAMRAHGIATFGALPGADVLPAAPVFYMQSCLSFYAGEVNRLCDLSGIIATPVSAQIAQDGPDDLIATTYGGPLNFTSAQSVLGDWKQFGPVARSALASNDVSTFWDALGRLAIGMNVDQATPDYAGQVWADILDNIKNLPQTTIDAVGKTVKAVGSFAGSLAGAIIWNTLQVPIVIGAIVAGLYIFRGPIMARIKG